MLVSAREVLILLDHFALRVATLVASVWGRIAREVSRAILSSLIPV